MNNFFPFSDVVVIITYLEMKYRICTSTQRHYTTKPSLLHLKQTYLHSPRSQEAATKLSCIHSYIHLILPRIFFSLSHVCARTFTLEASIFTLSFYIILLYRFVLHISTLCAFSFNRPKQLQINYTDTWRQQTLSEGNLYTPIMNNLITLIMDNLITPIMNDLL